MSINPRDWHRLFDLLDGMDEPERRAWLQQLEGQSGTVKDKLELMMSQRSGASVRPVGCVGPVAPVGRLHTPMKAPREEVMPAPKYVTLEVVSPKASGLGPCATHTFDMRGGRFGRASDNDWVINDRYVSRHQAQIGYASGRFYIAADPEASARMCINGPETQICAPEKYPLSPGDQIMIDEVLIRVDLSAERPAGFQENADSRQDGPFKPFDETYPSVVDPAVEEPFPPPPLPDVGQDPPERVQNPLEDAWQPTAVAPVEIKERWWETEPTPSTTNGAPKPPPVRLDERPAPVGPVPGMRDKPGGVEAEDLLALLKGAGIEASAVTPDMLTSLGAILRTVVGGVVEILRARAQIRREFRMDVTLAQSERNNPLKFSANAEDALHNILLKHDPAFLPPVEAFEEAFDDLRGHQLAMLKGMRAGYEHMLELFDPARLEEYLERQARSSGLKGLIGGSRLWDHYRSWFTQTTQDEGECFRRVFGQEFAKAYELEMQRLASLRRRARAGG